MPSDVYDIYPFAGTALGDTGMDSCKAQGFFIVMGTLGTLLSNTTLNLYYVCTIRYEMTEERFKKSVMPVMFLLSMVSSITVPISALRDDTINPLPLIGTCAAAPYPFGCTSSNVDSNKGEEQVTSTRTHSMECIRGNDVQTRLQIVAPRNILIGGVFAVMVISLGLVILSVFDKERKIKRSRKLQSASTLRFHRVNHHDQEMHDFRMTRAVMTQALMYTTAFLLTYVWTFISAAKFLPRAESPSNAYIFFQIFFTPLQGFFNAMIFIYQKVYTLRRSNTDLSLFGAFKTTICTPNAVPQQVISSIEIATEDIEERRQENSRIHRGDTSVSLRERVMANRSGLRRFGSNVQNTENEDACSQNNSSDSSGSSSLCLSSDISLGDILGPDDGREESISSDSLPLSIEEFASSLSVDVNMMTWQECSTIPEGDHEDCDEDIE